MDDDLIIKRVVVAMSGGVDSSVAAALLVEKGYQVIGITIKTYSYEDVGGNYNNESSCCSLDGINDARLVADKFGFPHYVLDLSEEFRDLVIKNFIQEYLAGNTPNPCVICNRKIKWEALIRRALTFGATHIATGHFAKVRYDQDRKRFILSRGKDLSKEQSYALWGLTQSSLNRTIFPLAEYTKSDVRELARRYGLNNASKAESFEICFIPDDNYERFLKEQNPELENKLQGGDIIFDGKVVGKHKGYPFYTIGQRKGLGVALREPVYVKRIDPQENKIYLGRESEIMHTGLIAGNVNLIAYDNLKRGMKVIAKVRYKDEGAKAYAIELDSGKLQVIFEKKKRAITPGQSVVLYENEDVIGGGVIEQIIE